MTNMTHGEFSIGVDLAKDSFEAAIAPDGIDLEDWRTMTRNSFPFGPGSPKGAREFLAWVHREADGRRCARVVVESTGCISRRFAEALRDRGLPEVAIINPARSHAFTISRGIREKTDAIEAAMLALYAAVNRPKPTPPRSAAEEAMREKSRLRESYVVEIKKWENRLNDVFDKADRAIIKNTIKHMKKQIERLDKEIERTVMSDAPLEHQVHALKQIKGIKQVTAVTLTAELGNLTKYSRTKLTAAAGLYPRSYSSGTSVRRRPRLVRGGGGRVRRVLYMGATSLFRSKGPLRDYIERQRERGLEDMCIIGALMRKLLLIARAVMKNDGVYDSSKICLEEI